MNLLELTPSQRAGEGAPARGASLREAGTRQRSSRRQGCRFGIVAAVVDPLPPLGLGRATASELRTTPGFYGSLWATTGRGAYSNQQKTN
jgi:hypothetical protein